MQYGPQGPLDFSRREFDPENGSKGKMPTLLNEWVAVGIQEHWIVYNLQNLTYLI